MDYIGISIIGTIIINDIYEDSLYTIEVSKEKRDSILKELQSGSLTFSLSDNTIREFLDFKPIFWCTIEAGEDLEYDFIEA